VTERRAHYIVQVGNVSHVQFPKLDDEAYLLRPDPITYQSAGRDSPDQCERSPKAGVSTPAAPPASENCVRREDKGGSRSIISL